LESSPSAFRSLAISLANAFASSRVYWYGSRSAESLEATGNKDKSLSGIRHFQSELTTSTKEKTKNANKENSEIPVIALCKSSDVSGRRRVGAKWQDR